jgi:hypothetical protein
MLPTRLGTPLVVLATIAAACSGDDFSSSATADAGVGGSATGGTGATGGGATGGTATGGTGAGQPTGGGPGDSGAGTGGGGKDAGVVAACAPGGLQDLKDDFAAATLDATVWDPWKTTNAAYSLSGGLLVLKAQGPSEYAGTASVNSYATSACRAWVEVPQVNADTLDADTYFTLFDASNNELRIVAAHDASNLSGVELAFEIVEGTSTDTTSKPYVATQHRFWQLRFASGQVYFETSPDGQTWTAQRTIPRPAWLGQVKVELGAGMWTSATVGTAVAHFDNFNTLP